MKYFENALSFLGKFFVLILPLYLLYAIPSLFNGIGTTINYGKYLSTFRSLTMDPMRIQNPTEIIRLFTGIFIAAAGASLLGFILEFLIKPATFGMVKKALETSNSDLNDFVPELKINLVKYIVYWIGNLLLWLVFAIAASIAVLVFVLLAAVLGRIGYILLALIIFCLVLAGIVLGILTSLWFPAMVVENLDIVAALKKSFKVAAGSFWTILGMTLLIWLIGAVAGFILGFLGFIPLLGSLIVSIIPAVTGFIMIVFYMMLYRDKVGGTC